MRSAIVFFICLIAGQSGGFLRIANAAIVSPTVTPNDEFYSRQGYLRSINVNQAWEVTTGSQLPIIAIIDSGVDINHPDLKDSIWVNTNEIPGDNIDNDHNGFVDDINGWDFVSSSPDPRPKFGTSFISAGMEHGTILAGVAAGRGNNGIGITGISWRSRIMPLRVINSNGEGDVIAVVRAIDYAIKQKANIINLSFVGPNDSGFLEDAISRAHKAGIVIVAASGNDDHLRGGLDTTKTKMYPACYDGTDNAVIGVASLDSLGQKTQFSNYGSCVDVSVPGNDFYSTQLVDSYVSGFDAPYGGGWSGTSLSTAVISGLAALILSVNSHASTADVMTALKGGCDEIDALNVNYVGKLGCGRVNVGKSVRLALEQTGATFVLQGAGTTASGALLVSKRDGTSPLTIMSRQGSMTTSFFPFGPFRVPFHTATSKTSDWIVVAAGKGGGPHVRIFDKSAKLLTQFFAYDKKFRGGINIAMGDINSDGTDEIVVIPESSGGPQIRIFKQDGTVIGQFFAYDKTMRTGWSVAVGDIDGDGKAEIITASRANDAQVRVFNDKGEQKEMWATYSPSAHTGAELASCDVNNDGKAEIITSPIVGDEIHISTGHGELLRSWYPYNKGFKGGINVSCGDIDGDRIADVVAGPRGNGGPHVRAFSLQKGVIAQFFAFEEKYRKGIEVGTIR
ncbi:MAG: S8 family serine peptidase [bacterium]|nr:S8 family serine peptidase [bacterium]